MKLHMHQLKANRILAQNWKAMPHIVPVCINTLFIIVRSLDDK